MDRRVFCDLHRMMIDAFDGFLGEPDHAALSEGDLAPPESGHGGREVFLSIPFRKKEDWEQVRDVLTRSKDDGPELMGRALEGLCLWLTLDDEKLFPGWDVGWLGELVVQIFC